MEFAITQLSLQFRLMADHFAQNLECTLVCRGRQCSTQKLSVDLGPSSEIRLDGPLHSRLVSVEPESDLCLSCAGSSLRILCLNNMQLVPEVYRC